MSHNNVHFAAALILALAAQKLFFRFIFYPMLAGLSTFGKKVFYLFIAIIQVLESDALQLEFLVKPKSFHLIKRKC